MTTSIVPSLIAEISSDYDLAMRASADAVTYWIKVGRNLIRLKNEIRKIRPKEWQRFVDHESGLPFRHHQASKAMAVARRADMLLKRVPEGELLKVSSLNQLLAMTVSDTARGSKRPSRNRDDDQPGAGKQKIAVGDLASLVTHLWQDWGGGRTIGYRPAPEKRELFEEALSGVVLMLTELAGILDIDLSAPSPAIDGEAVEVPDPGTRLLLLPAPTKVRRSRRKP